MRIGVKSANNLIDPRLMFYETNYDILPTPNFLDKTRLLKAEHGITYLGNRNKKECRFCGKRVPETTFRKIAHAFPESIGNKTLASYYECDSCNEKFGETIENDYATFFQFYHSVSGIKGKDKIPKFKSKECFIDSDGNKIPLFEMYWDNDNGMQALKVISNSKDAINAEKKTISFSQLVGKCCPIAVYKTLVKMAITVMPSIEVQYFSEAIRWILDENHENIFEPFKLLVRYEFIPGFNVPKCPYFAVYRRKNTVWKYPYMLFHLTYGCFSLLIEIPRDNDSRDYSIETIPMPPIPFYAYETCEWDLSEKKLKDGFEHSIQLSFDVIQDITDKSTIFFENGKRIIRTEA
nr:HNH endonuclease [uncultured Butyrivibrio sp.]